MQTTMIAAATLNRVIAVDGEMPWHLPDDLRHFHNTIRRQVCVVGRKTFEQNRKALAGAYCYIVSGSPNAHYIQSLSEAVERAKEKARNLNHTEIFVLGGESIYQQMINAVDRILLTEVIDKTEYDEQTQQVQYFPLLNESDWVRVLKAHHPCAGEDHNSHLFQIIDVRPR